MKVITTKVLTETTPFTGFAFAIVYHNEIYIATNSALYKFNHITKTFTTIYNYTSYSHIGQPFIDNDILYIMSFENAETSSQSGTLHLHSYDGTTFTQNLNTRTFRQEMMLSYKTNEKQIKIFHRADYGANYLVTYDLSIPDLTGSSNRINNYHAENVEQYYIIDNKVYVFGAYNGLSTTRIDKVFIDYVDANVTVYTSIYKVGAVVDGDIILTGGNSGNKKIYKYSVASNNLTDINVDLKQNQYGSGAVYIDNAIYIFGGYTKPENESATATNMIQVIEFTDYNLTFNFANNQGETLASISNSAPIESMRVNTVGSTVGVILNTLGGQLTTTYTTVEPSGYKLVGYGLVQGGNRVVIPVNKLVNIAVTSDTTFYEIYAKYTPIDTPIDLVLYTNTAESNRVDKTNFLTTIATLKGTLRESTSILSPSIKIVLDTLPTFNYCYIQAFGGRYYYVTNITSIRQNLWQIDLKVDVLMTYKTDILTQSAIINRTADTSYIDKTLTDNYALAKAIPTVSVVDMTTTNAEITFDTDDSGLRLAVCLCKARGEVIIS